MKKINHVCYQGLPTLRTLRFWDKTSMNNVGNLPVFSCHYQDLGFQATHGMLLVRIPIVGVDTNLDERRHDAYIRVHDQWRLCDRPESAHKTRF